MPSSRDDEAWTDVVASTGSLLQAGNLDAAIRLYDSFIELVPNHADAYYKRAVALGALSKFELALVDYERAIALNPRHGHAFCNRGSVLEKMNRKEEAVRSFDIAISINAGDFLAHYNRSTVLRQLGKSREALDGFDRAILLKPDYAEAYVNRGNVLQEMWRHEDAVVSFDRAIQLNANIAEAFQGRGVSLFQLREFEGATASFGEALRLNPHQKFLLGARRYAQMQVCDWDDHDGDVERLMQGVQERLPVSPPFALLALLDAPDLHRVAAATWIHAESVPTTFFGSMVSRKKGSRIKVGYFSADFRDHPVAQLCIEFFEHHDKTKFEITAFCFGPPIYDDTSARIERSVDRFIDVRAQSDSEVALLARKLEIDIAVDLGGLTQHSRPGIFAARAAPVQINYLGYPGTMGAEYIDYVIADSTVLPVSQQCHYAEKIIYLPHFYLPIQSTLPAPVGSFSREQFGLPATEFVFCCFNSAYKITPATFGSWMRILRAVKGSVLWLAQTNSVAMRNLRRVCARWDVGPERLIFSKRLDSLAEHRARLRHADLFLDTFPYNAHASGMDALWADLPIVTRTGQAFAGRVAASMLTAIGLNELVTSTSEQYEQLAIRLAGSKCHLASIKSRILRARASASLFDARRFTTDLETAYSAVFERYLQLQPPDHLHV